jgi:flagellar hook-associated protein 1 FlgK
MSLFGLFNIGRSAILASQAGLAITNNNIANVNTRGYSRREVILELSNPSLLNGNLVGSGVTATGIRRHYDRFIETQLLGQAQAQGKSAALEQAFSEIEQVFNESQIPGLSESLSDYFNAWQDVASNPQGQPERQQLLQRSQSLVRHIQAIEQGITDTVRHINDEIGSITDEVNEMASRLASLNEQIVMAEAGGQAGDAADFRDQRDQLLKDLGNLADVSSYENQDGSLTVTVGTRNLVSGSKVNKLEKRVNVANNYEFYLDGVNITSNLSKGRLGGFLSARADIESNPLADFRKLVASLIKEVNLQHQKGFGLDGSTGNNFFNTLQLSSKDSSAGADITSAVITDLSQVTLDEYDITFDASNNYFVRNAATGDLVTSGAYVSGDPIAFDGIEIAITGAVTASDSFFVSPLTDAVKNFGLVVADYRHIAASSTAAGLPGDNLNAREIAGLADSVISDLGSSLNDFYRTIVSYTGTADRAASDMLAFDNSLMDQLNQRRESISGVSLDEEAINLITFQRSFEAGAKMIQVTDELLQTILNL